METITIGEFEFWIIIILVALFFLVIGYFIGWLRCDFLYETKYFKDKQNDNRTN